MTVDEIKRKETVLIVRLLLAIDNLHALHPWWCKVDGDGQCDCHLTTLRTLREEIRVNANTEPDAGPTAEPASDPTGRLKPAISIVQKQGE